jgi:PAS domain S-box-containing protein
MQNSAYDIVLIAAPTGEELKTAETARIIYDNYKVPVLFITAPAGKAILEKTLQNSVIGFVLKPLVPKDVVLALELIVYRYTMENKLMEWEKKYAELLNSTFQTIVECDLEGKILNLNTHGLSMFGLHPSDLNKNIFLNDFIKENSEGSILEVCKRSSFIPAGNINAEFQLVNKSGKKYEIEQLLSPVYLANKLSGYRGVLLDITNRKLKQNLSAVFNGLCQFYDRPDIELSDVSDFIVRKSKDLFKELDLIYFDDVLTDSSNRLFQSPDSAVNSQFEDYAKFVKETAKPIFS